MRRLRSSGAVTAEPQSGLVSMRSRSGVPSSATSASSASSVVKMATNPAGSRCHTPWNCIRASHSPGRNGERRLSQMGPDSRSNSGTQEGDWKRPREAMASRGRHQSTHPGSSGTEPRNAGGNKSPVRAAGPHRAPPKAAPHLPLLRRHERARVQFLCALCVLRALRVKMAMNWAQPRCRHGRAFGAHFPRDKVTAIGAGRPTPERVFPGFT